MVHLFRVFLIVLFFSGCSAPHNSESSKEEKNEIPPYRLDVKKIEEAINFTRSSGYNQDIAFLLDMGIRSGHKRFFVVDLKTQKQLFSGLVTHGHCQDYSAIKPKFSNVSGSNCSSLGKYRIGGKYSGQFGTAYKLHGLEESNSNAFERFVVLHSHGCVPDEESVVGICESEGCPTVSPLFLSKLEPIIDQSNQSILLWIFNS